jgi:hypothetical protein
VIRVFGRRLRVSVPLIKEALLHQARVWDPGDRLDARIRARGGQAGCEIPFAVAVSSVPLPAATKRRTLLRLMVLFALFRSVDT